MALVWCQTTRAQGEVPDPPTTAWASGQHPRPPAPPAQAVTIQPTAPAVAPVAAPAPAPAAGAYTLTVPGQRVTVPERQLTVTVPAQDVTTPAQTVQLAITAAAAPVQAQPVVAQPVQAQPVQAQAVVAQPVTATVQPMAVTAYAQPAYQAVTITPTVVPPSHLGIAVASFGQYLQRFGQTRLYVPTQTVQQAVCMPMQAQAVTVPAPVMQLQSAPVTYQAVTASPQGCLAAPLKSLFHR
jgi:hypothetical protein